MSQLVRDTKKVGGGGAGLNEAQRLRGSLEKHAPQSIFWIVDFLLISYFGGKMVDKSQNVTSERNLNETQKWRHFFKKSRNEVEMGIDVE